MASHQPGPTHQHNLCSPLQSTPISTNVRLEIASLLWGHHRNSSTTAAIGEDDLHSYFRYYTEQSDLFSGHAWAKTHQDILDISSLLQQDLKKDELRRQLQSKMQFPPSSNGHKMLDSSIDLAIRLLLMMRVGHLPNNFSGYKALVWDQGPSLREFVWTSFKPRGTLNHEHVRLEKIFNGKSLEWIAGIKIKWTSNFADHLRILDDEDTQVAIFHHVSFLEAVSNSTLFPPGLIDETLRTLMLLFPATGETKIWFKKLAATEKLDRTAFTYGRLRAEDRQINEFKFWRDRLVILKQIFDEKEPSSWGQWLHDRRRGLHRYPFLVAGAALIFAVLVGIIQCIEGAIQTYKALYPS
ncbi:hypothetical protein V8E51_018278 [Hyaloscypha variabilis]